MASLYELTQNVMYLQNMLEAGDIDEQTYNDSVESMCVDGKLEDICMVLKNLEHKAAAYKAEVDRMNARKKTIDNSIRRLKDSMLNYMVVANDKKVEAGLFTVSLGKSKALYITDDSHIPEQYLIPQPVKIDRKGLTDAIKNGEEFEGVELVENPYITIR